MPDTTIMPASVNTRTRVTPSAGSFSTRAISGAAASAAQQTSLIVGRPDGSFRRDSSHAANRIRPSLANSDGSTWKPPGSAIQAFAPFTDWPTASTASRSSSDRP